MQFSLQLNTDNDNDDVVVEAMYVLESCGKYGQDGLLDALNGAYSADRRVSRGADTLGRESLHEALDMLDEDSWSEEISMCLLTGIMRRAIALKLIKGYTCNLDEV